MDLYQSNTNYQPVETDLSVPNGGSINMNTGMYKIGSIGSALRNGINAITKTIATMYINSKTKNAEEALAKYNTELVTDTVDLNNAANNTDISKIKLTKIDDIKDLTPDEQKTLLEHHNLNAKNFLYQKYFNKLEGFKSEIYSKYPKNIADKLYTQAVRDTYSIYTREYSKLTSDIHNEEKRQEVLNTTTNILNEYNKAIATINDPQKKQEFTDTFFKEIQKVVKSGEPIVIGDKEYKIDSNVLGVLNKVYSNQIKRETNDINTLKQTTKLNDIVTNINNILTKTEGNDTIAYKNLVAYKQSIANEDSLNPLYKQKALAIVDNKIARIKDGLQKKALVNQGTSAANVFINTGYLDPSLVNIIKNNNIAAKSFIIQLDTKLESEAYNTDNIKELKDKYINIKSQLISNFGNIPEVQIAINNMDTKVNQIIKQKNNEALKTANTLAQSYDYNNILKAIDTVNNTTINTDKKKILIDELENKLGTVASLNNYAIGNPIPEGIINDKNAMNMIAMKNANGLLVAIQNNDIHTISKIFNNTPMLFPVYKKLVNNLSPDKKMQFSTYIKKLTVSNPDLANSLTVLMSPKDIIKYNTFNVLKQIEGNSFNLIKAEQDYKNIKTNSSDYKDYVNDMRDKYGSLISDDEIKAAYMAKHYGIEDTEDLFESGIQEVDGLPLRNNAGEVGVFKSPIVKTYVNKIKSNIPNAKGTILTRDSKGNLILVPVNDMGTPLVDNSGKIIYQPIKVNDE